MNDQRQLYDRELLLFGAKRNAILDLSEVQRYGRDSYGDADYVSIYGMRPSHWHAKGARVLGRTAAECTRDKLGDAIGKDVAAIAAACQAATGMLVVDTFAGSANTLYWLLRHLPRTRGVGFESDVAVFGLTRQNIAALGLPIDILNLDYLTGLSGISLDPGELLISFIAPPWGNAFDSTSGLDLQRTKPPITDIVDFLLRRFSRNRLLCVIQVHEIVVPVSMVEVRARFDWSTVRTYELNARGQNHGILVGTMGWAPVRK
jgi:hypothetical protein